MPQAPPTPFAAALLAGGQSRRMGQDKALLDWGGQPLWQVQLGKIATLNPARVLLSCREEQALSPVPLGVQTVYDPPGNQGPLPAIWRCLDQVRLPLLVLGVDMPGMTADFLGEIVQRGLSVPGRGVVYEALAVLNRWLRFIRWRGCRFCARPWMRETIASRRSSGPPWRPGCWTRCPCRPMRLVVSQT